MGSAASAIGSCSSCCRAIATAGSGSRLCKVNWHAPFWLPIGRNAGDLDSVAVVSDWRQSSERAFTRAAAVLEALAALGGPWRMVSRVASVVPAPLANAIYGVVARSRYRIFGRYDACPLPPPEWRERFLE